MQMSPRSAGTKSGWRSRWRCPQGLRSEVVAFARERQAAGDGLKRIASDLGLSESGLSRWLRPATDGRFREVRLRPEPPTSEGWPWSCLGAVSEEIDMAAGQLEDLASDLEKASRLTEDLVRQEWREWREEQRWVRRP